MASRHFPPDARFSQRMTAPVAIRPFPGESIESMLRRFKNAEQMNGTLAQYAHRAFFVPRGQRRRSKSQRAQKRLVQAAERTARYGGNR